MDKIKIFDYIPELDCFNVTPDYKCVAWLLGLVEWNYVVWIGRLFTGDEDFGEHWFDNWDEREALKKKAANMGFDSDELYILNPKRFVIGKDGPSHTDQERKMFWTDVLKSLTLSVDTLAVIAARNNPPVGDEDHVTNLKKKIQQVRDAGSLGGLDKVQNKE